MKQIDFTYKLDEKTFEDLNKFTWRSNNQTNLLYNLVDGNTEKLKDLEVQIKNCYVGYCPDSKKEIEEIMCLVPKSIRFTTDEI